jgi:hypothetical protein
MTVSKYLIICFLAIPGLLAINACSILPIEPTQASTEVLNPSPTAASWVPSPGMTFQIQFSGELDLSVEANLYDLDVFDTDASTVQLLHQNGKHAICYINAGAVEEWRPDVTLFPQVVIGEPYQGWPGESWLDIRNLNALAPILEARLDLCKQKGFDGVEFDNVDGYQNETGFELTTADQLAFNRWLADAAHERGLSVGLKNDPEQIAALEPWFDFLILESCFSQGWCDQAQPFVDNSKLIIDIEYSNFKLYCDQGKDLSITLIGKDHELNSRTETCP